ncbi:hypothetical protein [Runella sp.]|uniref:hypothetical protein n=1 Tax=Runella sp. TaxID=1960881 RepID=UPI0026365CD1|nr:hypothetical protein [Runella sp.]
MAKDFMAGMKKVSSQLPTSSFSEIEKIKKQIIISEELRQFITPLTAEEYKTLEANLLKQGCKDPLTVWETTNQIAGLGDGEETVYVLIDGHNRHKICEQYNIDYKIALLKFEDIEKVKDYMIDFQLGRRNLTPEQMSYFRGLRYNREKGGQGKYDREASSIDLSKQLADEFQVSQRTIKNDGNFAAGVSKFAPELQQQVLAGATNLSRTAVQDLAKREDIAASSIQSLEVLSEPASNLPSPFLNEGAQLKKEIARLVTNVSTKSDYAVIVQKVKELKKYI